MNETTSHTAHTAPQLTLSLIVPCFNEEENVAPLIEAVFKVISSDPRFIELILVDDGSLDRTAEIVRGMAAYEPRLRLVAHTRNRGLGAAIRTGLDAATGDYVLYTDADLPFDFGQIPRLLMQACDDRIVIGVSRQSRRGAAPLAAVERVQPALPRGLRFACAGCELRLQAVSPARGRRNAPRFRRLLH